MPKHQIFLGAVVSALCVWGLIESRWILDRTKKGHKLVSRFGEKNALWLVRSVLAIGAILGGLLAVDMIRPLQW